MRLQIYYLLIYLLLTAYLLAEPPKVSLQQVNQHLQEEITLVFESHGGGYNSKGSHAEIYSSPRWDYPHNVIIRFTPSAQDAFKQIGIENCTDYFSNRQLLVKGVVQKIELGDLFRTGIYVTHPDQISIVIPQEYSYSIQDFEERVIQGFYLKISPRLASGSKGDLELYMAKYEQGIKSVVQSLPPHAIQQLQGTRFYLFEHTGSAHRMSYHPNLEYLVRHQIPSYLHQALEAYSHSTLSKLSDEEFKGLLIHELAHVYHDKVLTHQYKNIQHTYHQAIRKGLYKDYQKNPSTTVPRYASVNQQEYFAELTKAYFANLSYPPHNRIELQRYDPEGFNMIEKAWKIR